MSGHDVRWQLHEARCCNQTSGYAYVECKCSILLLNGWCFYFPYYVCIQLFFSLITIVGLVLIFGHPFPRPFYILFFSYGAGGILIPI